MRRNRLLHVLGCRKTAVHLAAVHGLNVKTVRRAALFHDITKHFSAAGHNRIFARYGFEPDEAMKELPQLWHAASGALLAEHLLHLNPEECACIRWHTTGRPGMSAEQAAVYIADMIEPTRAYPGVDALRAAADADLVQGLCECLRQSVTFIEKKHGKVHPNTADTLKWIETEKKLRSDSDYDA